jgi:hypothetical protein
MVMNLRISNPGLKAVSLNAFPRRTVRVFFWDARALLKEGVKTYLVAQVLHVDFFLSSHL